MLLDEASTAGNVTCLVCRCAKPSTPREPGLGLVDGYEPPKMVWSSADH